MVKCPTPIVVPSVHHGTMALAMASRFVCVTQEHTFKPVINNYGMRRQHEGQQRETFTRLSQDKKDAYRRLEQERLRQNEAREMMECSFQPKINVWLG